MSCLVIAEAGVNHNGQLDLAVKLVEEAAQAGADVVKFQTFRAEHLVTQNAPKAEYQMEQTGEGTQFEMLKALELSEADHHELFAVAKRCGIEFLSTAFDDDLLDFLVHLGIRRIKIPSGELTNHPFLRHAASKGLPLILSTGLSDLEEVQEAILVIAEARKKHGFLAPMAENLTLLHCTSNYPCAIEDVNLRAMQTLLDRCELPVGYSDHTAGVVIAIAATAMGASVLEKHFTLDRQLPGPDHQASLIPTELAAMVTAVRQVSQALGDGNKRIRDSELPIRALARRSIVLRVAKKKGSVLDLGDLQLLRPASGLPPKHMTEIVGRRVSQDMVAGTPLVWQDLEE